MNALEFYTLSKAVIHKFRNFDKLFIKLSTKVNCKLEYYFAIEVNISSWAMMDDPIKKKNINKFIWQ